MLGTSWWSSTSTHSGGFLLWEDSVLRGLGLGGTRGQAVNHLRVRSRAEEYSFMYEGAGLGWGKVVVIDLITQCSAMLGSC